MDILIFDMDGVLVRSGGYHRALQDTVLLIGEDIGFEHARLTDAQILIFESLGISSEWHSSVFCKAAMLLQQNSEVYQREEQQIPDGELDLEQLFAAIASQPMQTPPLDRGMVAVKELARKYDVFPDPALKCLEDSHSIDTSKEVRTFEEFVLGSDRFQDVYQRAPAYSTESYLLKYDQPLISKITVEKVLHWLKDPDHGAAVMTNRPSRGPNNFRKSPDAELALQLIGFETLPVIGYGDISWLADKSGKRTEEIGKPSIPHALAAILTASGCSIENSLRFSIIDSQEINREYDHLKGSTITVFEDTPAGIVSVKNAVAFLNQIGVEIAVMAYGLANDTAKASALSDQGAVVEKDINLVLNNLIKS